VRRTRRRAHLPARAASSSTSMSARRRSASLDRCLVRREVTTALFDDADTVFHASFCETARGRRGVLRLSRNDSSASF
jgi:hypothetical protein